MPAGRRAREQHCPHGRRSDAQIEIRLNSISCLSFGTRIAAPPGEVGNNRAEGVAEARRLILTNRHMNAAPEFDGYRFSRRARRS